MLTAELQVNQKDIKGFVYCNNMNYNNIKSYDSLGNCFSFQPTLIDNYKYAIDVELKDTIPSKHLMNILGQDALLKWCEIEIIAKLSNIPAHIILLYTRTKSISYLMQKYNINSVYIKTDTHYFVIGKCKKTNY